MEGFVLQDNACTPTCSPGSFQRGERCFVCHSSCASCWGPSASQCSECQGPLLLNQGPCVDSCGEGLYPQDNTCHNCHPSCRSCQGLGGSDCLRCLRPEDVPSPCRPPPPPWHLLTLMPRPPSTWTRCTHAECTTGSADDCTSCLPPTLLHEGQCVSTCPPGTFPLDHTCAACHATCEACSGESAAHCLSCPPLASLQHGSCRTSCPDSTYLHHSGDCHRCSEGCQRCVWDHRSGVGSVCLRCGAPGDLLLGDHCVSQCPWGLYPRDGACRTCDEQCGSCSGPGVCTSCRDPAKVLLFGECQYDRCAHQYYLNTTTRTCTECEWRCNVCRGPRPDDCLQCMEGFVLQDNACTPTCSPGLRWPTVLIAGGPGACLRCKPPYSLLGGQCGAGAGGRSHS
ncbi:hypothetical protein CRUP_020323 [Coryphaenoides rupestris]|nr:hypothetical protein CRUP_020323 [Coryphaenoides rupestris]